MDLFSSNDIIGECKLNLRPMIEDAENAKRPMSLSKNYYDEYLKPEGIMDGLTFTEDKTSFWIELKNKEEKNKKMETVVNGKLRIQISVYPKKDAEDNKVGEARSEPNVDPYLPLPFGRISFSLNPLKMLNQLIGPALRRKIYCYCCIAICVAACVFLGPAISAFVEILGLFFG